MSRLQPDVAMNHQCRVVKPLLVLKRNVHTHASIGVARKFQIKTAREVEKALLQAQRIRTYNPEDSCSSK